MIKYEYINIAIPASIVDTMAILKEYNDVGWRMATMYNGLIFFDRKVKTKIR